MNINEIKKFADSPQNTFNEWEASSHVLRGDFNGVDGRRDDGRAHAHQQTRDVQVLH